MSTRLRAQWPDSPGHATAAVGEWTAAKRGRRPVAPGAEARGGGGVDEATWQRCTDEVRQLRETLRQVPVEDRAAWAAVAHDTAGVFAAWSARVEPVPGPLAATSDALARSAEVPAWRGEDTRRRGGATSSVRGAAMLLAVASQGGSTAVLQALLVRQLANTVKALHDAHAAAGEARRAATIATAIRQQLDHVNALLPADAATAGTASHDTALAGATTPAVARPGTARQAGSPIPTRLDPERPRTGAMPTRTAPPGRDGPQR